MIIKKLACIITFTSMICAAYTPAGIPTKTLAERLASPYDPQERADAYQRRMRQRRPYRSYYNRHGKGMYPSARVYHSYKDATNIAHPEHLGID